MQENPAFPAYEVGAKVMVIIDYLDSHWSSSHEQFSTGEVVEIRNAGKDEFIFGYSVKVGTLCQWHPCTELQLVQQ